MEKKLLKKLQKYVKKEWDVKITIKPEDTLIKLSELIAIKKENCCYDEIYQKWIIQPQYKLPYWICVTTITGFLLYMKSNKSPNVFNKDTTIEELLKEIENEDRGKNWKIFNWR